MTTRAKTTDGALTEERHDTTMYLPCALTEDELRSYGDELAGVVQDIAAQADREKEVKAELKARTTELTARQSMLAMKVSRRQESREVACVVHVDYEAGLRTVTRTDTGEVVQTRPLRDDERQPALPVEATQ